MKTRICSRCKQELPLTTEFFSARESKLGGFYKRCKKCEYMFKSTFTTRKETKICCRCKRELPATLENFSVCKRRADGLLGICKDCDKIYRENRADIINPRRKLYRDRNKDLIKRTYGKWSERPETKLLQRGHNIKRYYGITIEEVQNLMDSQRGCCEICGDSLVYPNSDRSYMIDHNHTTGSVRGLLCSKCNMAIGQFRENKEILESAIRYLEKHSG